jgi:ABC-type multidrug transport system ATPase subunit
MKTCPAVELEGARVEFSVAPWKRRRVLDQIDLVVRQGESIVVVGPSGAGKTTLLRLMLGLVRARAGRARLFGSSTLETRPERPIGYLPDDHGLWRELSGREHIALHAGLLEVSGDSATERAGRLGLAPELANRVATYSLGMRVRLGLTLALMGDPELLVLDEPFTGIDLEQRARVRDELAAFHEGGGTIIASSHLLLECSGIATRVIAIVAGRVVADEPAERVFGTTCLAAAGGETFARVEAWYRAKTARGTEVEP